MRRKRREGEGLRDGAGRRSRGSLLVASILSTGACVRERVRVRAPISLVRVNMRRASSSSSTRRRVCARLRSCARRSEGGRAIELTCARASWTGPRTRLPPHHQPPIHRAGWGRAAHQLLHRHAHFVAVQPARVVRVKLLPRVSQVIAAPESPPPSTPSPFPHPARPSPNPELHGRSASQPGAAWEPLAAGPKRSRASSGQDAAVVGARLRARTSRHPPHPTTQWAGLGGLTTVSGPPLTRTRAHPYPPPNPWPPSASAPARQPVRGGPIR
jgi:hypothetical protein